MSRYRLILLINLTVLLHQPGYSIHRPLLSDCMADLIQEAKLSVFISPVILIHKLVSAYGSSSSSIKSSSLTGWLIGGPILFTNGLSYSCLILRLILFTNLTDFIYRPGDIIHQPVSSYG
jgi:hypothetical protein